MGYQALLFCPDEKTARTVTQVLSELDFSVVPCNEPFAAVKQLMAEHFDALVVDCDNEQNATLLFKSARNTTGNQSSLAVAVVEGQAGVAKAFRIGANLVLTKPINVEQAKGTLRVARGLLRKGETAKQGTSTQSASKPSPQVSTPAVVTPSAAAPAAPFIPAATSIPFQKLAPPVTASNEPDRAADFPPRVEVSKEITSPLLSPKPAPRAPAPKSILVASVEPNTEPIPLPSSTGFGTGSASAPAPAREKARIAEDKPAATIEPEIKTTAEAAVISLAVEASAPAALASPEVATSKPKSSGGSKTALIGVAAVLLIAAAGYEAWLQWGQPKPAATPSTASAIPVAKAPVSTPSSMPSVKSPAPSSSVAPPESPANISSTPETSADAPGTTSHQNKVSAPESNKSAAPATVGSKASSAKASAKPIVIKSDSGNFESNAAPEVSMIAIAGPGEGAALPSLMGGSNAPTPVLQTLTISQGVSQGLLMKQVQPAYPASALRMHIEGGVQLLATVSKTGNISAIKILSGDSQLAKAATDAVKQWKYKPYLLNGSPVEIQTQITVNFKLPR
jgi:periplasmic protein TonB